MKKNKKVVLDPQYLDEEEREIVEAFNRGELKPVENQEKVIAELQEAAIYTRELRKKTKNMNIRLAPVDIEGLKKRAAKAGLPYQTLIGVVLHKVATGQIEIEL